MKRVMSITKDERRDIDLMVESFRAKFDALRAAAQELADEHSELLATIDRPIDRLEREWSRAGERWREEEGESIGVWLLELTSLRAEIDELDFDPPDEPDCIVRVASFPDDPPVEF